MQSHRLTPRLTYCSNVHPLHSEAVWRETIRFFGKRMGELAGKTPFPLGMWFSHPVLAGLDPARRESLREELRSWGVSTFTFNAFPYGDFHQPVVKREVYLPDWTDPARLAHTKRCAELQAVLLPEGEAYGSISTLPLGWREGWTPAHSRAAAENLVELARHLSGLRDRTGRTITLALEPEPGCALERTPQATAFWEEHLRPAAARAGAGREVENHLGVCYDTCHQAVQFEDAEESLAALHRAGIRIRKMQLSSALEFPADPSGASRPAREAFVEPRFLHQTRVRGPEGVTAFDDLPEALEAGPELFPHPWRVHYHVPVHAESLLEGGFVRTTRPEMLRALRYALAHDLCSHFEVETYTWSVLPESHRPKNDEELARAIARELEFIRGEAPGVFD